MSLNVSGVTPLLQVFDMHRSVAFYRDVLGCTIVSTYEPEGHFYWAMLKLGDAMFMLNAAYEDDQRPSSSDPARVAAHADTILYFGCDSVEEVYSHLRAKGSETEEPRTTHYGMRQVYTKDPDGYELCFQHEADTSGETATS